MKDVGEGEWGREWRAGLRVPVSRVPVDRGDEDRIRRSVEMLESRVGMTLQTASRAETAASLASGDETSAGGGGGGGQPAPRACGYMKPQPFHAWRGVQAKGWEIYVPDGAVRGPGGEELKCLSCDVVDSAEHRGCRVLPAQAGKYKMCVVRCVVAPGGFPQDFCGTESPAGKLFYNVFLDGSWDPDRNMNEWRRESPDIDVVELGVPAGQRLEGTVWFTPNPRPMAFDYDQKTHVVGAGRVVDWGSASYSPDTEGAVAPYTLPAGSDWLVDADWLYLAFQRTCFRTDPAQQWERGPWGLMSPPYAGSTAAAGLVAESAEELAGTGTTAHEYKFVPLYHFTNGVVDADLRFPVSMGGGGGGGSSVPDCRWIDPVSTPTEPGE